jgi:hypothetical protein
MFVSVRKYHSSSVAEVTRRVQEGFLPLLRQSPGFMAYYVVDGGDGWLTSISLFEDRAGAENSTRLAADWVRENIAALFDGAPDVVQGEAVVAEVM